MSVNIGEGDAPVAPNFGLIEQAGAHRGNAAQIAGQSDAATLSFLGDMGSKAYQAYQYNKASTEATKTMNELYAPEQGWIGATAYQAKAALGEHQSFVGPMEPKQYQEFVETKNALIAQMITPQEAASRMAADMRRMIASNPGAAQSIRAAYQQHSGHSDWDLREYQRATDLSAADAAGKAARAQQDRFFESEAKDVLVPMGDGGFRGLMPSEVKAMYGANDFSGPVGTAYLMHKRMQNNEQQKKDLDNVAAINKERGTSTSSPNIQKIDLDLDTGLTKVYGAIATMQPMLSQNNSTMMGEVSALRNSVEQSFNTAIVKATAERQAALAEGKPWSTAAANEYKEYITKLEQRRKAMLDTVMEGPKSMMDARKILAESANASAQEIAARAKYLEPLLKFTSDQEKTLLLSESGRQQILAGKHSQFKEGGQVYLMAKAIDDEVKALTTNNPAMRAQAQSSAQAMEQSMEAYRKVMGALSPEAARQELAHINDRDRKLLATAANTVATNVHKQVAAGTDAQGTKFVPSNEHVNNLFVSADNFTDAKESLTSLDSVLKSGNLKSALGDRYDAYAGNVATRSATWLFGGGETYLPSRVRSMMLSGTELAVKDGVVSIKSMGDTAVQTRVRLANDVEKINTLISIHSQTTGTPANEVAQRFMERLNNMSPKEYNRMVAFREKQVEPLINAGKAFYGQMEKRAEELEDIRKPRENNYLNLTNAGKEGKERFARFGSADEATDAYLKQIDRYISGATTGKPLTTVEDIVGTWNNEKEKGSMSKANYLKIVMEKAGLAPDEKIDTPAEKATLLWAMQFAESGKEVQTLNRIKLRASMQRQNAS